MKRMPLDGRAAGLLVVLCATWGLQQVAVKVAAPALNPVLQIGLRSLVATGLLLLLMRVRGQPWFSRDASLRPGLIAGLLFAVEFLFVAWGLMYTTASHMVVFLYTTPVFTALGLHVWVPGERLLRQQWLGVILAFCGIVIAFSGALFRWGEAGVAALLLGDAFGVIAGLLWAATTVLIRSTALSDAPAMRTMLYQLGMAGILLSVVGHLVFQSGPVVMTPIAWLSMGFQSLIVGFASMLTWFWMLRRYLAARMSVFTFLTPLFGVSFGVLLLDDPLDPGFLLGAVLVGLGITLVNWRPSPAAAREKSPRPRRPRR